MRVTELKRQEGLINWWVGLEWYKIDAMMSVNEEEGKNKRKKEEEEAFDEVKHIK